MSNNDKNRRVSTDDELDAFSWRALYDKNDTSRLWGIATWLWLLIAIPLTPIVVLCVISVVWLAAYLYDAIIN